MRSVSARALRAQQNPVEEVALDRPGDAALAERRAGHQILGIVRQPVGQGQGGDRLGDDGQIGVLEEKRVVADIGAVGHAQQTVPEIAFQRRLGAGGCRAPDRAEIAQRALIGDTLATELHADRLDVRWQPVLNRDHALEPAEDRARLLDAWLEIGSQLLNRVFAEFVGAEGRAVGRDADEPLARGPLSFWQVAAELLEYRVRFPFEVALELEHGSPQKRVDPAPHLGNLLLEIDARGLRTQTIGQESMEKGADLFMARLRYQFGDDRLKGCVVHGAERIEDARS